MTTLVVPNSTAVSTHATFQCRERIKCGEVYTSSNGDQCLYDIECVLCEEKLSFYKLSDYAKHMQIWHSDIVKLKRANSERDEVEKTQENVYDEITVTSPPPPPSSSSSSPSSSSAAVTRTTTAVATSTATVTTTTNNETEEADIWEEVVESVAVNGARIKSPEPPRKLTSSEIRKLIELYKKHQRLWNSAHPEHSEKELTRQSWREIAHRINKYCQANYSVREIQIRITALCFRYRRECERRQNGKLSDNNRRFKHFESLKFLNEQQSPTHEQRTLNVEEDAKLLEIYEHFPVLWHTVEKHRRPPEERIEALYSMSKALQQYDIYLTPVAVHRRLQVLRKNYRLTKIRNLYCYREQKTFETNFKHYEQMQFLHKHIDPYICDECGMIFQKINLYCEHIYNGSHEQHVGNDAIKVDAEDQEDCEDEVEDEIEIGVEVTKEVDNEESSQLFRKAENLEKDLEEGQNETIKETAMHYAKSNVDNIINQAFAAAQSENEPEVEHLDVEESLQGSIIRNTRRDLFNNNNTNSSNGSAETPLSNGIESIEEVYLNTPATPDEGESNEVAMQTPSHIDENTNLSSHRNAPQLFVNTVEDSRGYFMEVLTEDNSTNAQYSNTQDSRFTEDSCAEYRQNNLHSFRGCINEQLTPTSSISTVPHHLTTSLNTPESAIAHYSPLSNDLLLNENTQTHFSNHLMTQLPTLTDDISKNITEAIIRSTKQAMPQNGNCQPILQNPTVHVTIIAPGGNLDGATGSSLSYLPTRYILSSSSTMQNPQSQIILNQDMPNAKQNTGKVEGTTQINNDGGRILHFPQGEILQAALMPQQQFDIQQRQEIVNETQAKEFYLTEQCPNKRGQTELNEAIIKDDQLNSIVAETSDELTNQNEDSMADDQHWTTLETVNTATANDSIVMMPNASTSVVHTNTCISDAPQYFETNNLDDAFIEEIIGTLENGMLNSGNFNIDCVQTFENMLESDNNDIIEESVATPLTLNMEKDLETVSNKSSNDSGIGNMTPQNEMFSELIAKVDCGSFSYDLKLNPANGKALSAKAKAKTYGSKREAMNRLNVSQIRQLIEIFKDFPVLWDPNNDDYNSRKKRRVHWKKIANRLNEIYSSNYMWKTLHRKLSDFVKYYKREKIRIIEENSISKWVFFDDFNFLDDVILLPNEPLRALNNKTYSMHIINTYKATPELWDTGNPEYYKRKRRKRYILQMTARIQKECNIPLQPERLQHRIQEFRSNYRTEKERRLEAQKQEQVYTPTFLYTDALSFLEEHVAPFVCADCTNVIFKRHSEYLEHRRMVHQCAQPKHILLPPKDDSESLCHVCGSTFNSRSNLMRHMNCHRGLRSYACSKCSKKFFNSTSLAVHESSHSIESQFTCEYCKIDYEDANELYMHMRELHPEVEVVPPEPKHKPASTVCNICKHEFGCVSKLKEHMKRHNNQRDFPCHLCQKAFYSAFDRDRHVRRHLNIRDKVCPVCGKAFVVGSSYYAHMMLHNEKKRYSCKPCDKEFAQYVGLYKHRKSYHPEQIKPKRRRVLKTTS